MKLELAKRRNAKMRLALQGPAGSGKTWGALQIAYGLCSNWSKIAVIDTENHSASLYAHLGNYSVLNIGSPYSPEKYIEAIRLCEEAGMEVIVIDSISHEWEASGGILDVHAGMSGNSFANWGKLTPRHNAFIQSILQSSAHIIGTIRSKQDYVLNEKNGKQVPEKVGLKAVTREGLDYEFTIVLDLDIKHNATASKDRTGLFMDQPEFKLNVHVGEQILQWCNQGAPEESFLQLINSCNTVAELYKLHNLHPQNQEAYHEHFVRRKKEVMDSILVSTDLITNKSSNNGNSNK